MDKMAISKNNFYNSIKNILEDAKSNAYRQINFVMVEAYWSIGQQIVEEEQRNIYNMKKLNLALSKMKIVSAQLTWSYYTLLLRVEDTQAREWYMNESANSNWSIKALERDVLELET